MTATRRGLRPARARAAVTLAFALIALGLTGQALAQSTLGTIRGTIFDPQRQIAPGTTVVATDEATSLARETTSDASANFELPNLRPGSYTVEARLAGFKTVKRTGVLLRATTVVRVDLQLEI